MQHRPKVALIVLFALPMLLAGWFMTANLVVSGFWPMSCANTTKVEKVEKVKKYSPCQAAKMRAQAARIERARAAALAAQVDARVRAEHATAQTVAQWPSAALTPQQVVRAQMEALRRPDFPRRDAGIARAFRFASPANRAAMGPAKNFARFMRKSVYAPMLNNTSVSYDTTRIHGNVARQGIAVIGPNGERAIYEFHLRRQTEGVHRGSWMTAGVTYRPLR